MEHATSPSCAACGATLSEEYCGSCGERKFDHHALSLGHFAEHAFEAFFSTKPAGRGTGLGLPLCKSIIEGHGGRVELESLLEQGTSVRLWLPLDETTS